jgi:signal transduction histidine kinase
LTSLRPQEIDDLGLVPSLLALIADHNASAKGATRFTLDVKGSFDGLSAETRAHVYRIVQEGLTNAAKHAQARAVAVTLRATGISDANGPSSGGMIMLDVIDDGSVVNDSRSSETGGIGLIGMRERVLALNGRLDAGRRGGGGFGLHAEFPYQPQAGAAE